MADLSDFGVDFDDEGRLVGFQAGKAAALLEYQHRKEAREFERLIRKMYFAKWHQDNKVRRRERTRERYWLNPEAARLYGRLRARSLYARKHGAPRAFRCKECGLEKQVRYAPMPRERTDGDGTRGPLKGQPLPRPGKFCSVKCANAYNRRARKARDGIPDKKKLNDEQVVAMRSAHAGGESVEALSGRFSTPVSSVWGIVIGRTRKAAGGPIAERVPRGAPKPELESRRLRERRRRRLAKIPCATCGGPVSSRRLPRKLGRLPKYCSSACQKARASAVLGRREQAKRARDARRAAGLCLLCGSPSRGESRCEPCKEARRSQRQLVTRSGAA